jgi:hypothetical protein
LVELRVLLTPDDHRKFKLYCLAAGSTIQAELWAELARLFRRRGLGELTLVKANRHGKGARPRRR